jgi:hypothetical protein
MGRIVKQLSESTTKYYWYPGEKKEWIRAGVALGIARALANLPSATGRGARLAAVTHTGRAAWRALAHGFGGAAAAVLILNLPHRGVVADWVLPIVPAVVGALAHQAGMLYERLPASASTSGPAKAAPEPAK